MSSSPNRMPLVDALKAVASQIILLHHFSSYGPLAATAREALPGTLGWLFDYGRMAVQVFLVIAGFLAARGLSGQGQALAVSPLPLIWKRYLRLAVPFLAAIGFAIVASALADQWLDDEAIPDRATFGQWLAHATLLHGILGVDALSAGVWYIAIDFQLFALMALLLWLGRYTFIAPLLALTVTVASLFWFNRDAGWDNWALYFFGAYGLGAAAWWAADHRHLSAWLGVIAAIAIAALIVDFRLRIALALGVALVLGLGRRSGLLERCPEVRPLAFLGQISYSVFLVHFPVLLLANAVFAHFAFESAVAALAGLALAWLASIATATAFYRWIESPAASRRIAAAAAWLLDKAREAGGKLPGLAGRLLTRFVGRA